MNISNSLQSCNQTPIGSRDSTGLASCVWVMHGLLAAILLVSSTSISPVYACGTAVGDVCASHTQSDATSVRAGFRPAAQAGNPVSLTTGNKFQREADYESPASRLQFVRYYNSNNTDYDFGFGRGWTTTYSVRLLRVEGEGFAIIQGNGKRLSFSRQSTRPGGGKRFYAVSRSSGYVTSGEDGTRWFLPDGRVLHFNGSFLVRITFPDQQTLSLYYRDRRVVEIQDQSGQLLQLDYTPGNISLPGFEPELFDQPAGHLAALTLPDGTRLEYDYNNRHALTRVRYADDTSRQYHYEDEGYTAHLTGVTDRVGYRSSTWVYDADGRAAVYERADDVGRIELDYTLPVEAGSVGVTTVINAQGEKNTYHWQRIDGVDVLLSSEGPGCSTCPVANRQYTYTDDLQVSTVTDEHGVEHQYQYDDQGRLSDAWIESTGVKRHLLHQEFTDAGDLPTLFDRPSVNPAERHQVRLSFNNERQVTQVVETGFAPDPDNPQRFLPIERTTSLQYTLGKLSQVDGPRKDVEDISRYFYDQLDRLERIEQASGEIIHLQDFDAMGRAQRIVHGSQRPLNLAYDQHGNVTRVEQFGRSVEYDYDARGKLVRLTDPDGKSTHLSYDASGRLVRVTDDAGLVSEFNSDAMGRIRQKSFYGPDGAVSKRIRHAFDAAGRIATVEEHNADNGTGSRTFRMNYSELGQLATVSDVRAGVDAGFSFDAMDRLTGIANAEAVGRALEYDHKGQNTGFVDERGNRTQFLKDDFGRTVALISADTGTSHYRYDEAGNRISKTGPDGLVTHYEWDAANRLILQSDADGVTRFRYHPQHGRLASAENPDVQERFEYNLDGQLVLHVRKIDAHSFKTGYAYNTSGRLYRKMLPDGQSVRYHYHKSGPNRGLLQAITRESLLGLSQETLVAEIDSDARDGASGYLSHNGVRTERRFNSDGSIRSVDVSNALSLQYTFDEQGNLAGIDENGFQQHYRFESGNLVSALTRLGDFRYTYDDTGNRIASTTQIEGDAVERRQYQYAAHSRGNRLQSITDTSSGSVQTIAFNSPGSPTHAASGLRYEYNSQQRPIKVFENDTLLAEYTYNPFGERVRKRTFPANGDIQTRYFLYDGHFLSAEADGAGDIDSQYLYLIDGTPVAKLEHTRVFAIHADHLGTPRRLTDSNRNLVWDANYTPFGKAHVVTETVSMQLRLPGQYEDVETGTHYNYFRDYDPATGRYITADPIGLQGGANSYQYALNSPTMLTDVLGLTPEDQGNVPVIRKPGPDFTDRLSSVMSYTIARLRQKGGQDTLIAAMNELKEQAIIAAGLFASMGVIALASGGGALPVLAGSIASVAAAIGVRALWVAGVSGVTYLYNLFSSVLAINNTSSHDCDALKGIGDELYDLSTNLGGEVVANLFPVGKGLAFFKDIFGKLKKVFKAKVDNVAALNRCSFHGDTLVRTTFGLKPIRSIRAGIDHVLARHPDTHAFSWKRVVAKYSNRYDARVTVTTKSLRTGKTQSIVSNRIHPFLARSAAGLVLAVSAEGHTYNGPLENTHWVDAQNLRPGDQLLDEHSVWHDVLAVSVSEELLVAFNLTVDKFHTYFVAGSRESDAVWVHNTCFDTKPDGFELSGGKTQYGQEIYVSKDGEEIYRGHDGKYYTLKDHPPTAQVPGSSKVVTTTPKQLQKKYKHAADFGVKGNYNKANARKFDEAIQRHVNSSGTKVIIGSYRGDPVTFHTDPVSGLTVIQNPDGSFLSGWKLNPQQLYHVLNDGKL